VPEKARKTAAARAVDRIGKAKAVLVEPQSPFLGIIMDPHAPRWGGEKIDMMTEREPATAEPAAKFGEQVGKTCKILHPCDVVRECVRGVHCRHSDPWRRRLQSLTQTTGTAPRQGRRARSSQWAARRRRRSPLDKVIDRETSCAERGQFQLYSKDRTRLRTVYVRDR
jgi:hypothetical protein